MKGDCDFSSEHEKLRQCLFKERGNSKCCASTGKLGMRGYEHCLELCDGTRKHLSKSPIKYTICKKFLKDVVKCAKSS